MSRTQSDVIETAEAALAEQAAEMAAIVARQLAAVASACSGGTGDINAVFSLDVRFRLVFVRCHFAGTSGAAPLVISLDSTNGSAYDTRLFTITRAGIDRDVNLRISAEESTDPSPWTFQAGDAVRVEWTNPDSGNITWGLEVGLVIAS